MPREFLVYGGGVYQRSHGEWQELTGQEADVTFMGMEELGLEAVDALVTGLLEHGDGEVSRTALDGEDVYHLSGEWSETSGTDGREVHEDHALDVWIGVEDSLVRRMLHARETESSPSPDSGMVSRVESAIEVKFFDYHEPQDLPTP